MLRKDYNLERKEEFFTTMKKLPDGGKIVEHYKVVEASPGVSVGYRNRIARGIKISNESNTAETSSGMFDAQPWVVSQCCFRVKISRFNAAGELLEETPLPNPVPATLKLVQDEWVNDLVNDLFDWINENSNLNDNTVQGTVAKLCREFGVDESSPLHKQELKMKLEEFLTTLEDPQAQQKEFEDEAKN